MGLGGAAQGGAAQGAAERGGAVSGGAARGEVGLEVPAAAWVDHLSTRFWEPRLSYLTSYHITPAASWRPSNTTGEKINDPQCPRGQPGLRLHNWETRGDTSNLCARKNVSLHVNFYDIN